MKHDWPRPHHGRISAKAAFHAARMLEEAGGADLFEYLRQGTEFEYEQDWQHFLEGVRLAITRIALSLDFVASPGFLF